MERPKNGSFHRMIKIIFDWMNMNYICSVKNVILILAVIMLTKPLWPVLNYVANYKYIVNELCENRDKPEMHCNGKCYLTKELAKEATDGENNPLNNKISKTEIPQVIISENFSEFQFAPLQLVYTSSAIEYKPNLMASLFISKILHPPRIG